MVLGELLTFSKRFRIVKPIDATHKGTKNMDHSEAMQASATAMARAAAAAESEWLASAEDAEELEKRRYALSDAAPESTPFEYDEGQAAALYESYGLEPKGSLDSTLAELATYHVRDEAGHRPIWGAWDSEAMPEMRGKRADALRRATERKVRARRWHCIADVCLVKGKKDAVRQQTRAEVDARAAKAAEFRAAAQNLPVKTQTKVRRYMREHGVSAAEAVAAVS